ncbi:hypothetical protein [Candidatus Electronema sp. PJ]
MRRQCRGVCGMSGERYLLDTNAIVALLQGDVRLGLFNCSGRLHGLAFQ